MQSLRLVDEESNLLELEVHEPILLMHRVATKVVAQDDMPAGTEGLVQEFLQIFSHLSYVECTCSPSLSNASLAYVSCFLISLITASRISSGQSRGQRTSAPKIVR